MSQKPLSKKDAQEAVDAVAKYGDQAKAARALNIYPTTFKHRFQEGVRKGLHPSENVEDVNNIAQVKARLKRVESELRTASDKALTHSTIKQTIINLGSNVAETPTPKWVLDVRKNRIPREFPLYLCQTFIGRRSYLHLK